MSNCATKEEIVNIGRTMAGMGPNGPPGTNLHVTAKFGRTASHCTSREELDRREVSLYY